MAALEGPDFFIVGAPKCGTTAMADYLGQHPEIGMCPRKETHVFATDLYDRLGGQERPAAAEPGAVPQLFAGLQEEPHARRGFGLAPVLGRCRVLRSQLRTGRRGSS